MIEGFIKNGKEERVQKKEGEKISESHFDDFSDLDCSRCDTKQGDGGALLFGKHCCCRFTSYSCLRGMEFNRCKPMEQDTGRFSVRYP